MNHWIVLMILVFAMHGASFCQEISFPEDKDIKVSSIVPIYEVNEVQGYYALVEGRAIDAKVEWNLLIMDINFQIILDTKFTLASKLNLVRSAFNGTHFCLTFLSLFEKKVEYHFLDRSGKLLKVIADEKLKQHQYYPEVFIQMLPVKNTGFMKFFSSPMTPAEDRYQQMYSNSGELLWTLRQTSEIGREHARYHYADENFLVLDVVTTGLDNKTLKTKSNRVFIGYHHQTGNQIFVLDARHEKGYLNPLTFSATDTTLTEFGQYFGYNEQGTSYDSDVLLGLYTRTIDQQGKILYERFTHMADEILKGTQVGQNVQLADQKNIWMHDVIQAGNGKHYAICEIFKKNSGLKYTAPNILEMLVIEFDEEFNPIQVHLYEKIMSTQKLPSANFDGTYGMGLALKSYGMFDYRYSAQSPDKHIFTSVYDNYDKTEGQAKKFVISAIGLNRDQELVNPKIELSGDLDGIYILPAKSGYVAIVEFNKKTKSASLILHKFDM